MRKIIALFISLIFILGVSALGLTAEKAAEKPAQADKCGTCHKGDKSLDKVVAKKNIKSSADLMKSVKSGPTAKLHEKLVDADYKDAAKALKLAE